MALEVIEEIGREVKTQKVGDFVVESLVTSDNTCEICQTGFQIAVRARRVRPRAHRHPGPIDAFWQESARRVGRTT